MLDSKASWFSANDISAACSWTCSDTSAKVMTALGYLEWQMRAHTIYLKYHFESGTADESTHGLFEMKDHLYLECQMRANTFHLKRSPI